MMNSDIKISVILPVYNVEKYLPKCLDSIVAQTYENLEIICINDGTKDNSAEIINKYAMRDSRIRVINQTNKGLSATRNIGISLATGDYIHFVDTDDYVGFGLYQKFVQTVQRETRQIDIFIFNGMTHLENREIADDVLFLLYDMDDWGPLDKSHFKTLYMHKTPSINTWGVWNKIYRREFLLQHQFRFLEGCIFEDKLFNAETLLETENIYIYDDILYCYKGHSNSITQVLGNNVFDLLRIADGIKLAYLKHDFFDHAKYSYFQYLTREVTYGIARCRRDLLPQFLSSSRMRLLDVAQRINKEDLIKLPFYREYQNIMSLSASRLLKIYSSNK